MGSREAEESALMQRIADGDENALRLLYHQYGSVLFALALHMVRDQTQAEEIVQDTFVRIWQVAQSYDPTRGKVESWVITIARNLTLSRLRKTHETSAETSINALAALPDSGMNPEEMAWVHARRQMVRDALAQLPLAQRHTVELAYFAGLTHAEIAEKTGDPIGTVKSRLRLALKHLQTLLGDDLREDARQISADEKR